MGACCVATRDEGELKVEIYPPKELGRTSMASSVSSANTYTSCARIVEVAPNSPFDDAGFTPGCIVTALDEQPLRDIIDWWWLSADDVMDVAYIDLDGDAGVVTLEREVGQSWGVEFDGVIFDAVLTCRNACTFCFMRQLPSGMRPSLSVRDDDFRLSFLSGTFVTLTNLSPDDEARIIEQRISPLRFSLQAISPDVRKRIIGKRADHGLAAAERLLAAGIELHAQIVLMPSENDGDELTSTLKWAYDHPGVLTVGVVPLGYTSHQTQFKRSFNDPIDARAVLATIYPFQKRAIAERGYAWAYASDELYCNAWGDELLEKLPDASFYGNFDMFEDGIGIIRTFVDEWNGLVQAGIVEHVAQKLRAMSVCARLVVGEAMEPFFSQLIERAGIADVLCPLVVKNRFFGGNVDVTGLLTGKDIADALRAEHKRFCRERSYASSACQGAGLAHQGHDQGHRQNQNKSASYSTPIGVRQQLFFIPNIVLNDDGVLLDDLRMEDIENQAGVSVHVVSCSPAEYLQEIADVAQETS